MAAEAVGTTTSRTRVSYLYDDQIGSIVYDKDHAMSPSRVRLAHQLVRGYGLESRMNILYPTRLSVESMKQFHTAEYVEYLRTVTPETSVAELEQDTSRFVQNLADCPIFPGLFDFCQISSGASVDAAYRLNHSQADVAINWSGGLHHAKKSQASGFCFPELDTRVLTNRGFLFLAQIEKELEINPAGLLYACYNKSSKQIVYRPGELVIPDNTGKVLLNFSPEHEKLHWSDDSLGDCVEPTDKNDSNHMSLRVTPNHDMFVCTGSKVRGDNKVQWSAKGSFRKMKAIDLVSRCNCPASETECDHRLKRLSMLACAEDGVCLPSDNRNPLQLDFALVLQLFTLAHVDAFVQLYGFWLADGSMDYGLDAISFSQKKSDRKAFLKEMISLCGLQDDEWSYSDKADGSRAFRIHATRWFHFFDVEYMCKCTRRERANDVTQDSYDNPVSNKFCFSWVLQSLERRQLRLLIEGLSYGSGNNGKEIFTSCPHFRDELVVVLLHAGFTAHFELQQHEGQEIRSSCDKQGHTFSSDRWRVCYAEPSSHTGKKASFPQMLCQDVTEEFYDGRIWCVRVDHADHLLVAQRAQCQDGVVTKASRPVVVGNCFTNDCVLSILELLKVHQRVLYIDIDIHHGDGVEEAFAMSDRVMTVSFHKYAPKQGFFPRTGNKNEQGFGAGKGYSLNVPLEDGIGDESYQALFTTLVTQVVQSYQPGAIVLQCGADSLAGDYLGSFNLSTRGHASCVKVCKSFHVPVLLLGGGGYTISNVARAWSYETAVAIGCESLLPSVVPLHEQFASVLGASESIHVEASERVVDNNSRTRLTRLTSELLERLKSLPHAPSVQYSYNPPRNEIMQAADEQACATKEDTCMDESGL